MLDKIALITGINGQDGSYLAEFLLDKNYEVLGTVKRNSVSETQSTRIEHLRSKDLINLEYVDMTDMASLIRVISKIKNDEIYTPKIKHCLNGITRGTIIRLCKEYEIPIYQKDFLIEDVHQADEVFVTGTFSGVIPVVSVDGIKIGNGKRGKTTKLLQEKYVLDIEKIISSS